MNFNWDVFWQYLLQPSDVYLTGLWLTCVISVLAMLLGCFLVAAAVAVLFNLITDFVYTLVDPRIELG